MWQGRGGGRMKVSSRASLAGGQQHFLPSDNGISMTRDLDNSNNKPGSMTVYKYNHDHKYQIIQVSRPNYPLFVIN